MFLLVFVPWAHISAQVASGNGFWVPGSRPDLRRSSDQSRLGSSPRAESLIEHLIALEAGRVSDEEEELLFEPKTEQERRDYERALREAGNN